MVPQALPRMLVFVSRISLPARAQFIRYLPSSFQRASPVRNNTGINHPITMQWHPKKTKKIYFYKSSKAKTLETDRIVAGERSSKGSWVDVTRRGPAVTNIKRITMYLKSYIRQN
ncbi:hypothetical protein TWF569_003709 [Orbilia oligospora]|uniref:Uncharacterized protein n=1 Tax=Orbilia oligospora TaxID=2813651 RepID=A0A7C8NL85_ORBOL|nr:hypothetical protein TWF102_008575 [Orbilia oligospora]KAF3130912.1 hypothetical protein TWF594_010193 [Orbilia oligospora]KAF3151576.1 hypothetical protein TWF569_003709 [Orbilia oligospora]